MTDGPGAGPQALEDELRQRLAGYRMVFEMGLDEPTVARAREAIAALARGRAAIERMLATYYPATVVTYIAGEANATYDGALWKHISIPQLQGRGNELGPAFERATRALGLEPFEQLLADGALRYVSPILAHGGIPRFSARDFWKLLTDELQRTPGADAQEVVALSRQRAEAFRGIDAPVRRFLLYGGQPALDFLDRCIDLANGVAGQQLNLPVHIVETFEHLSETRAIRVGRRGPLLPRPRVLLDPWDSVGPVVELPAVAPAFVGARWRVSGETVREYRASSAEARTVPLAPAPAWEVEFIDRSLAAPRTYRFEALVTPALCFDPSNKANVRTVRPLYIEDVWLITPDGSTTRAENRSGEDVEPRTIEELPPLAGEWRGFSVRHLDLRNLRTVAVTHPRLDGEPSPPATLQIVPASARARLVGVPTPGVLTAQGFEVLAERPSLFIPEFPGVPATRWQIQLRADVLRQRSAAELGGPGKALDLATLLPDDYLGAVEISVRGPLGSDLRGWFAIAPGLRVTQPPRVLLPGEPSEVTIEAGADVAIAERPAGEKFVRTVAPDESQFTATLRRGTYELPIQVRVAKLQWALHRADGQSGFGTDVLTLDVDELRASEVDALLVSTSRPDVDLWLVAERSDGQHVQVSERARTSRLGGRWRFPLEKFVDTIAASGESSLTLVIRIEGHSVKVAQVIARLDVRNIRTRIELVESQVRVLLEFSESRPLRGRVAYLWPLDRPWDPLVEAKIPDGVSGVATFEPGAVATGAYRAQIAIADPWNPPRRPRRQDANVADIIVDTQGPSEDTADPQSMLATVMRRAELPPQLTDAVARSLSSELIACVVAELADTSSVERPTALLRLLARLLFADVATGSVCLADALASDRIAERDALRFAAVALRYLAPADVTASALRTLWRTCAPIAAAIDVPRAWEDTSAAERVGEFAGWVPGRPLPRVGSGLQADGGWFRWTASDIRALQRDWNHIAPAASLAAYVLASYEWIAVAKESVGAVDWWWRQFASLTDKMPPSGSRYVKARRSTFGPAWARSVPAVMLAAAFHAVQRDEQGKGAEYALAAASTFAPKLVAHDVCFAIIAVESDRRAPPPPKTAPMDPPPPPRPGPPTLVAPPAERAESPRVLAALRSWSESLRKRSSFLIFSDAELRTLARYRPSTITEMAPLLPPDKVERYGAEILRVIEDATR